MVLFNCSRLKPYPWLPSLTFLHFSVLVSFLKSPHSFTFDTDLTYYNCVSLGHCPSTTTWMHCHQYFPFLLYLVGWSFWKFFLCCFLGKIIPSAFSIKLKALKVPHIIPYISFVPAVMDLRWWSKQYDFSSCLCTHYSLVYLLSLSV